MKKILVTLSFLLFTASMVMVTQGQAGSGFCYICKSGSSCQYCESPSGKDTQDDRKYCKNKGCDIGGTASCPTAANYTVCR
jgi:hypothetical protein